MIFRYHLFRNTATTLLFVANTENLRN